MDLDKIPLFAMLTKRMAWLQERQRVLALNVANADTPGFRPKDLRELDFKRLVRSELGHMPVRRTDGAHIEAVVRTAEFRSDRQRETFETAPDGNAVVIEEQLMKVAETQADYQTMTNLYKKHVAMLKLALGTQR